MSVLLHISSLFINQSLPLDAPCLLTPELHHTLDKDRQSLKEQTDKFQLEKLDKSLEDVTTQIRNHHIVDRISALPIFTDSNMPFGSSYLSYYTVTFHEYCLIQIEK